MTPPSASVNQWGQVLESLEKINCKLDDQQSQIAEIKTNLAATNATRNEQLSHIQSELELHRRKHEETHVRLRDLENFATEQRHQNKLLIWIGGLVGAGVILAVLNMVLSAAGLV